MRYLKTRIQRCDEHAIYGPWHDDFIGYEEPHSVREVLDVELSPTCRIPAPWARWCCRQASRSTCTRKGADGIIDISPFSCMNGIVTEAIYPAVQRDLDGVPIRVFYFDGTQGDLERDVGIFIELAHTYRRRKKKARRYPVYFGA